MLLGLQMWRHRRLHVRLLLQLVLLQLWLLQVQLILLTWLLLLLLLLQFTGRLHNARMVLSGRGCRTVRVHLHAVRRLHNTAGGTAR